MKYQENLGNRMGPKPGLASHVLGPPIIHLGEISPIQAL